MGDPSIEWTDKTWNPTRGCSKVSEGCRNCYAERVAARFSKPGQPYEGTILGGKWSGTIAMADARFTDPLRWRKSCRIFVNSMSDLFHEALPDEAIDRVFAVMAMAPSHTFQVLTKRPERMRRYFETTNIDATRRQAVSGAMHAVGREIEATWSDAALRRSQYAATAAAIDYQHAAWPLPNVWLGVSVEDQAIADERIPLLLKTPAVVRFVSYEPALAGVDFRPYVANLDVGCCPQCGFRTNARAVLFCPNDGRVLTDDVRLNWVIVGGESGPGARPFDVAWARSTVAQCKAAGVACFVKQLGARPRVANDSQQLDWPVRPGFDDVAFPAERAGGAPGGGQWWTTPTVSDRKGGDMAEWPEDLRVREFPVGDRRPAN